MANQSTTTYNLTELEFKALAFLRESEHYKYLWPADKKELARMKAMAASKMANNLIASGEPDFVAWARAIREEIQELASDCVSDPADTKETATG